MSELLSIEHVDLPALCLYHYYEASVGPFRHLSDLDTVEAAAVQQRLRHEGLTFAARRADDYLAIRCEVEQRMRALFISLGGLPRRASPHYMVVEPCEWLRQWYKDARMISIPLSAFSPQTISFTYGDSFPALRCQDGKPYRGRVYTLSELAGLLTDYGLPQVWNRDGSQAPERYIEAQIWDDAPLQAFLAR